MVKNIVIIYDYAYINGGAANVAIPSAIALSEYYNVIFFAAVGPVCKELANSNVSVVCLDQGDILHNANRLQAVYRGLWNQKAKNEIQNILNSLSPQETIVHIHGWTKGLSASIFDVILKRHYKTIMTLHDYFLFCPNGGFFNYKKRCICKERPMSAKCIVTNCDVRNFCQKIWRCIRQVIQNHVIRYPNLYYISISKLNNDIAKKYLPAKNIYYLQNPININLGDYVDIANNKHYLFMGRLSNEKGLDLFCQAISQLKLNGIVLGDGALMKAYKKTYPTIEFCGWKQGKEKERIIKKCKALVFPSLWYECAPLTIIESLSFGLPCIVPDQCAASEQIIDGQNGFVFKTGNLLSLKESIQKFEIADLSRMSSFIKSNFDKNAYTLDNHLKGLIQIYKSILQ